MIKFYCLFALLFVFSHSSKIVVYVGWGANDIVSAIHQAVDAGYNAINLEFWMSSGPADTVQLWSSLPTSTKQSALSYIHSKGAVLIMSVGGSTEAVEQLMRTTSGSAYGNKAASFAKSNLFDGVDFDLEFSPGYNQAFIDGSGISWIVECHRSARSILGSAAVITHAPQAPYLGTWAGPKYGYVEIYKQLQGDINWLNVQYYNQGQGCYTNYETLFLNSSSDLDSVTQIKNHGIPLNKIIVGKYYPSSNGGSGVLEPSALAGLISRAHNELGYNGGVMVWCYLCNGGMNTNQMQNWAAAMRGAFGSQNEIKRTRPNSNFKLVTYIDSLTSWWSAGVATAMDVPGYSDTPYTHVLLAFWLYNSGPADAAMVWSNPTNYFGTDFMKQFCGSDDVSTFQKALIQRYHSKGKKVLVSAFGSTQFPTSSGYDPVDVANQLAKFVITNNLDGVDIDWEDNDAMDQGKGEAWIIQFTTALRSNLPRPYLISHAPQAPYFMGAPKYVNGGYLTVHSKVGSLIDWYNIQFYNQVSSSYSTYQTLYLQSDGWATGTSVQELIHKNINASMLVVGKPVTTGDATNTGYVPHDQLTNFCIQAKQSLNWDAGIMSWQYSSDSRQSFAFAKDLDRCA